MFSADAHKLAAAGADFFVCPDNTHTLRSKPKRALPIPALHIGEVVAEQARSEGRRKVGILGTNWTMTGRCIRRAGPQEPGMGHPDEADRAIVHVFIFDELVLGVFSDEAALAYVRIIDKLARAWLRFGSRWSAPKFRCDLRQRLASADSRFVPPVGPRRR